MPAVRCKHISTRQSAKLASNAPPPSSCSWNLSTNQEKTGPGVWVQSGGGAATRRRSPITGRGGVLLICGGRRRSRGNVSWAGGGGALRRGILAVFLVDEDKQEEPAGAGGKNFFTGGTKHQITDKGIKEKFINRPTSAQMNQSVDTSYKYRYCHTITFVICICKSENPATAWIILMPKNVWSPSGYNASNLSNKRVWRRTWLFQRKCVKTLHLPEIPLKQWPQKTLSTSSVSQICNCTTYKWQENLRAVTDYVYFHTRQISKWQNVQYEMELPSI